MCKALVSGTKLVTDLPVISPPLGKLNPSSRNHFKLPHIPYYSCHLKSFFGQWGAGWGRGGWWAKKDGSSTPKFPSFCNPGPTKPVLRLCWPQKSDWLWQWRGAGQVLRLGDEEEGGHGLGLGQEVCWRGSPIVPAAKLGTRPAEKPDSSVQYSDK